MIIFKPTQNKFFDSYRNKRTPILFKREKIFFLTKIIFSTVSSKLLVSRWALPSHTFSLHHRFDFFKHWRSISMSRLWHITLTSGLCWALDIIFGKLFISRLLNMTWKISGPNWGEREHERKAVSSLFDSVRFFCKSCFLFLLLISDYFLRRSVIVWEHKGWYFMVIKMLETKMF